MAKTNAKTKPTAKRNSPSPAKAAAVDAVAARSKLHALKNSGLMTSGEIGRTGLKMQAGRPDEEWNQKLKGKRGINGLKEMRDQDVVVGTGFTLIELVVGRVPWRLDVPKEAEGRASAKAAQELVESCRHDMSHTWNDAMTEAVSGKLWAGFHVDEIVYKVRGGPDAPDAAHRSKYSDGKIGWRKFASRSQETVEKWIMDDADGVQAFVQRDPNHSSATYTIPMEKALLFRHRPLKNNPEGRSILRHAWTSYFTAKRIREDEAIGISRDFTGMPMFFVPQEFLGPNPTPEQQALVDYLNGVMQQLQTGERNGAVLPAEKTEDGKETGFAFKLMSSPGQKQHDSDKIIRRYEAAIAMALMVEFIMLGRDNVGSWALDEGKQTRFGLFIEGVLTEVRDVMQRFAIDRLCALNGIAAEDVPQLAFGEVRAPNLTEIASLLMAAHSIDALDVDDKLRDWIREIAKLPERDKDDEHATDPEMAKLAAALARAETRGDEKMAEAIRLRMQQKEGLDPAPSKATGAPTGATAVQDEAFNGAQVTGYMGIIDKLAEKKWPKEAVRESVLSLFKGVDPGALDKVLNAFDGFEPAKDPTPTPGNFPPRGGPPAPPPGPPGDEKKRAA